MVRWDLLCLNLCPVTEKSLALSALHPPLRYFYTVMKSCLRLLSSRLNSPCSLILSLQETFSRTLTIFIALCWTSRNLLWLMLFMQQKHKLYQHSMAAIITITKHKYVCSGTCHNSFTILRIFQTWDFFKTWYSTQLLYINKLQWWMLKGVTNACDSWERTLVLTNTGTSIRGELMNLMI